MTLDLQTEAASATLPVVLTAAGSDSSAGAGIQADLKTFGTLGTFGLTAVSAVVAEVPGVVSSIHPVPAEHFREQLRLLFDSYPIAAAKSGMLGSEQHVLVLAEEVERAWNKGNEGMPLVVDPVLAASTGDALASRATAQAMEDHLFPLATVVTPNLHEAGVFVGHPISSLAEMEETGKELVERWGCAVLLKGGHLADSEPAVDLLFSAAGQPAVSFSEARIANGDVHGTGCTYAAAITAHLARGYSLEEAIGRAKKWTAGAIRGAFSLGDNQLRALDHRYSDESI